MGLTRVVSTCTASSTLASAHYLPLPCLIRLFSFTYSDYPMELGGVILPQALERAVFETAALLYHTQIPTLMLVARRFHTWLQPILYRVLVYFGSKDFSTWHRFPPIVRGLACYCRIDPSFIPYFDRIRPQLLCVDAGDLFDGPPDFSHSLFSSITHLAHTDINISAYSDESWKSLASLPSLTHLGFDAYSGVPARLLHVLLEEPKPADMGFLTDTDNPVSAYPTHDVRFIMAAYDDDFVGNWIRAAWGQADVWDRADNFIRLKRRGKVPKGDFADVEL
ncbi:hypothetical protein C8J57DRAFT_1261564 [Mycena rebaudengoi]|nr:hypothetical protein C8J57DRAFT_1261564 [Mycena rebaudengoi]